MRYMLIYSRADDDKEETEDVAPQSSPPHFSSERIVLRLVLFAMLSVYTRSAESIVHFSWEEKILNSDKWSHLCRRN